MPGIRVRTAARILLEIGDAHGPAGSTCIPTSPPMSPTQSNDCGDTARWELGASTHKLGYGWRRFWTVRRT